MGDFFSSMSSALNCTNEQQEYEPFYYFRELLKAKFGDPRAFDYDAAAAACGDQDRRQFCRKVDNWMTLCNPEIPKAFFEYLNCSLSEIDEAVSRDQDQWHKATEQCPPPTSFTARLTGAVYCRHDLPEGVSEQEAVDFVKEFAAQNKLRCLINFSWIKTISIEPNGLTLILDKCPYYKTLKGSVRFYLGSRYFGKRSKKAQLI